MLTWSGLLLLVMASFLATVTADSEHLRGTYLSIQLILDDLLTFCSHSTEMRFKFWLQPGTEECYHELLENGTSIYFMYEILNAHAHDSSIIAYFRNAYNGSIVAISTTPQRGHLEIIVNETCK